MGKNVSLQTADVNVKSLTPAALENIFRLMLQINSRHIPASCFFFVSVFALCHLTNQENIHLQLS